MLNAFTIDVEDYFHVSAFADRIRVSDWDRHEQRIEIGMNRLLALLDRRQVRATCFVLGWVAERHPQLIRRIQAAGHEIASHSYDHRLVYDLTPDQFREDLRRTRSVLEEITAEPAVGYRAPSFSIVKKSLWALDVLAEEGFQFDSSIYPVRHDRYGIPDARLGPHRVEAGGGQRQLWEFPGTVAALGGARLPVGGGGYFRFYPYRVSTALLRRASTQTRQPFMFYIHPWELDPEQPWLAMPFGRQMRHRVNLAATERRLDQLLEEFPFGAMTDVLNELGANGAAEPSAADSSRLPPAAAVASDARSD